MYLPTSSRNSRGMTRPISQWASAPIILSLAVPIPPLRFAPRRVPLALQRFRAAHREYDRLIRSDENRPSRHGPDMRYPPRRPDYTTVQYHAHGNQMQE